MKTARSIHGFRCLFFRITGILPAFLLPVFMAGCLSSAKPHPGSDAPAEALSHFSLGLLAESGGDSAAALNHLEAAIRLDPDEERLYSPAVSLALKLERPDTAVRLANELVKRRPDSADPALLLARVYALTGKLEQAEVLFKKTAQRFPGHPDAPVFLARFYLTQERRADAVEAVRRALETQGGNAELLHLMGTLLIDRARAQGDTPQAKASVEEAVVLFRTALAIEPEPPVRWQQLGFSLQALKRFDEALEAFKEAHRRAPGDMAAARQIMDMLIWTGKFEEALAVYEKLADETGTGPEAWLQYMAERMPEEQRAKLIAHLEEHIRRQPDAPVFYYAQLGSLYLGAQKNAAAEEVLLKALKLYPGDSRLRIVLGYIYLRAGRYDEAYATLRQVRTGTPDAEWSSNSFYTVNFLIAAQKSGHLEEAAGMLASLWAGNPVILDQYMHSLLTQQTPGSTESAVDLLSRFSALCPEAVEALYYLMVLQAEQKEYTAALKTAEKFETAAQETGKTNLLSGQFYYQYASLYERTGRLEEAERLFLRAIELDSGMIVASARNYIAYMWAERGQKLDEGLRLIRQALDADPGSGAFLDTLGWIYYMQGRYAEALNELQKARSFFEDDPTIWEHLGDTYSKLGNRDAAVAHWRKALELDPGSAKLLERLEANGVRPAGCPEPEDAPADTMPRP
jgi:tetratricopeptide (TPR) repeat protein